MLFVLQAQPQPDVEQIVELVVSSSLHQLRVHFVFFDALIIDVAKNLFQSLAFNTLDCDVLDAFLVNLLLLFEQDVFESF